MSQVCDRANRRPDFVFIKEAKQNRPVTIYRFHRTSYLIVLGLKLDVKTTIHGHLGTRSAKTQLRFCASSKLLGSMRSADMGRADSRGTTRRHCGVWRSAHFWQSKISSTIWNIVPAGAWQFVSSDLFFRDAVTRSWLQMREHLCTRTSATLGPRMSSLRIALSFSSTLFVWYSEALASLEFLCAVVSVYESSIHFKLGLQYLQEDTFLSESFFS